MLLIPRSGTMPTDASDSIGMAQIAGRTKRNLRKRMMMMMMLVAVSYQMVQQVLMPGTNQRVLLLISRIANFVEADKSF